MRVKLMSRKRSNISLIVYLTYSLPFNDGHIRTKAREHISGVLKIQPLLSTNTPDTTRNI